MTEDNSVTLDLTDDQVQFLLEYAVNRILEEEIERRRKPALFQPKPSDNTPWHPTYTPT